MGIDECRGRSGADPGCPRDYLLAIRADEWSTDDANSETDDTISDTVATLELAVREQAARSELGTPTSTELLTSIDSLTSARRTRLAEASRQMPTLYILTLVASGAALVANAGVLGFRSRWRTTMLAGGLAVGVALCLSLLVAISEPWNGALEVSGDPIDSVIDDLASGYFGP